MSCSIIAVISIFAILYAFESIESIRMDKALRREGAKKIGKYKTEWHIRLYAKTELHDLQKNKKLLQESKNLDTHTRLIIAERIGAIEKVLSDLSEYEKAIADKIFNKRYSQAKAECEGIGIKTYYNVMNKTIYLVARELNLI